MIPHEKLLLELQAIRRRLDTLIKQISSIDGTKSKVPELSFENTNRIKNYGGTNKLNQIEAVIIAETQKALLLRHGDRQGWIAKSLIMSDYNPKLKDRAQTFALFEWILRKNFTQIKAEVTF